MPDAQAVREKWFLKSKTIIGLLIAFLPGFLSAVGITAPDDLPSIGDSILGFVDAVNEAAGTALILVARWTDGGTQTARLTLR